MEFKVGDMVTIAKDSLSYFSQTNSDPEKQYGPYDIKDKFIVISVEPSHMSDPCYVIGIKEYVSHRILPRKGYNTRLKKVNTRKLGYTEFEFKLP